MTLAACAFAALAVVPAAAQKVPDPRPWPHHHVTRRAPVTWQTCVTPDAGGPSPAVAPLAFDGAYLAGPYRVYDDAWQARTCITTTTKPAATGGASLRITTSAPPAADGTVVAYPDIQYGSAYGYTTKGSGLPVRVSRMGHPYLWARAGGYRDRGAIADFDSWFFPTRDTRGHGSAELVIVIRGGAGGGGYLVRAGGREWHLDEWTTCLRESDGECQPGAYWPLVRYVAVHQSHHVRRLPLAQFVRVAEGYGWIPRTDWWGSTAFGWEVWSGGRGLTAQMMVRR